MRCPCTSCAANRRASRQCVTGRRGTCFGRSLGLRKAPQAENLPAEPLECGRRWTPLADCRRCFAPPQIGCRQRLRPSRRWYSALARCQPCPRSSLHPPRGHCEKANRCMVQPGRADAFRLPERRFVTQRREYSILDPRSQAIRRRVGDKKRPHENRAAVARRRNSGSRRSAMRVTSPRGRWRSTTASSARRRHRGSSPAPSAPRSLRPGCCCRCRLG
jgi:hypothetical protein